ncbi:Protein of unknown function [Micromonospora lupini str. Lupac 08]|uniref:Uncharacterized protein n=1 Tax=Micromonospora lupini str. Lupac 08 TaxID=1150864 RepID=I0L6A6_9ACTN|nr:Protein of unknown function [Micromonospora lupini str. Lupac 08]
MPPQRTLAACSSSGRRVPSIRVVAGDQPNSSSTSRPRARPGRSSVPNMARSAAVTGASGVAVTSRLGITAVTVSSPVRVTGDMPRRTTNAVLS